MRTKFLAGTSCERVSELPSHTITNKVNYTCQPGETKRKLQTTSRGEPRTQIIPPFSRLFGSAHVQQYSQRVIFDPPSLFNPISFVSHLVMQCFQEQSRHFCALKRGPSMFWLPLTWMSPFTSWRPLAPSYQSELLVGGRSILITLATDEEEIPFVMGELRAPF